MEKFSSTFHFALLSFDSNPNKMFKFFVFVLLLAFVNAQWREGVRDSRCPVPNNDFPTFLPGETCETFYKCNSGFRCKSNVCGSSNYIFKTFSTDPFECYGGQHWNTALSTCDRPEEAGCA